MYVIVIDGETTLRNDEVGKFKAHPMCSKNRLVWLGAATVNADGTLSEAALQKYDEGEVAVKPPPPGALVVGQNISFDIQYLCGPNNKYGHEWRKWVEDQDSLIWDTKIAEYRLLGQSKTSPSLDYLCESRGWPVKPSKMKEYWDAGICTTQIPDEEIAPYLKHDVTSTGRVFLDQLAKAQARGMLEMLRIEMQSRLTTMLMELNGMHFEAERAIKQRDEVIGPLRAQEEQYAVAKGMTIFSLPEVAVKPGSPKFLKAVLYGGAVKWTEKTPMFDDDGSPLLFKSGARKGEQRTKNTEVTREMSAMSPIILENSDEDALSKIIEHPRTPGPLVQFLTHVIAFRDAQKQERTYFTGYSELTWPDGMIHGNLNHAIAATGRLTSTNPNLQNAGHSPIRECFTSRYEGGQLMEVDLSQIEVVVQAFLSGDQHMIEDIKNGVDFHSKRAAFAHGKSYEEVKNAVDDKAHPEHAHWTKVRKGAKVVSFQKAYGAGVKKIVATTGLSEREVKAFMDAEDTAYPEVPKTQERWIEEVKRSTMVRDGMTCGVLTSPIGVEYRFFQDFFNGRRDYKPTTIKNYPIQGFSADILKIILAGLRGVISGYNQIHCPLADNSVPIRIVNTVHDSVIFDLPSWVDPKHLGRVLKKFFTERPITVLKDTWGIDFNVPISADVDVGKDWRNMETIEV